MIKSSEKSAKEGGAAPTKAAPAKATPAKAGSSKKPSRIVLPCLRGRIGDWMYYSTLMSFAELAKRVKMADELHPNKELSRLIQREVGNRIPAIVDYITTVEQMFFNSIIVGIYGGTPYWQGLDIDKGVLEITEEETEYLGKTFGILTLGGEEKIFAIDGQHRVKAIQSALPENAALGTEEVSVIFVGHQNNKEGEVRTRRLFSTLNRYAKPVSPSEIIALDEEDNAAILTRRLIEEYKTFDKKIIVNQTKSISPKNKKEFTNIIMLYNIILVMLTDFKFVNAPMKGNNHLDFITRRLPEKELNLKFNILTSFFDKIISTIPSLADFFKSGNVDRESVDTSLIFRPIGQTIMFNVIRIAQDYNKEAEAISFFAKDDFNIKNAIWSKVFINAETGNITTTKLLQKAAVQVILEKIGVAITRTKKEQSIITNLAINLADL